MASYAHLKDKVFDGQPLTRFDIGKEGGGAPAEVAWLVEKEMVDPPEFPEVFDRFVETVDTGEVTTLALGWAGFEGEVAAESLLRHAGRFPRLRALHLGYQVDFAYVRQGDVTPVLERFPRLERLDVRGKNGLALRPFRHETLRTLRFESCCLFGHVARALGASDLPALEYLDLWLGVLPDLDAPPEVDANDLAPLLNGERFPALRHLGLENSWITDEFADVVATAPVVARLRSLSLALGTLTDAGVESLLTGQPLTHLQRLDLHHHYLSPAMMDRVPAALPGVDVDLGDHRGEFAGPFDEEAHHFVADGRDF
ncbi:hypothetical protein SAMN06297387_12129 [Streptomyces zhaozhouensis]|uniref:Leucine Rich repeat-containing protein n=1 Tax=Streptomyces zhaozhouensis TaxID=1300267 RepID=A0A286E2P4_9ACTN|nr:cytoplasmic protein [Streptomyces zhaozhouensis]SOD65170.1 hypothetical protein SAMN06297387_12129 [Streptomyces zhaozhouensis]